MNDITRVHSAFPVQPAQLSAQIRWECSQSSGQGRIKTRMEPRPYRAPPFRAALETAPLEIRSRPLVRCTSHYRTYHLRCFSSIRTICSHIFRQGHHPCTLLPSSRLTCTWMKAHCLPEKIGQAISRQVCPEANPSTYSTVRQVVVVAVVSEEVEEELRRMASRGLSRARSASTTCL